MDQLGPKKLKNLRKCLKLLRKTPGVFEILCVCVCLCVFLWGFLEFVISELIHPLKFFRDFPLVDPSFWGKPLGHFSGNFLVD